ncbi:MAG: fused MFS/spermidine synthase [Patescibacteria group bacterium]
MFLSKLLNPFKKNQFPSKVNDPISVGRSFGKKAIFIGAVPQSGGEFNQMWAVVIENIKHRSFHPKTCLMLGVAGGTAINILKKTYPEISITGVELDPVILQVAKDNSFFVIDSSITIELDDAIEWVKKDTKKYDLIIVDLYHGDLNPSKARQKSFLQNVKNLLKENGVVLYNCHFQRNKEEDYITFRNIVDKLFFNVEEVFIFPKNKILLFE